MISKSNNRKTKQEALGLLSKNLPEQARDLLEQVCQSDCKDVESWIYLVKIYAQINQPSEVERCCRAIISKMPDSDEAYYNLGCALMMQQKLSDAVSTFRKAIELNPKHALALFHLGKVLQLLDNINEALSCFSKAIHVMPDLAEAYCEIGKILENKGRINDAMEYFQKALQIKPNLVDPNIGMGIVLAHTGDLEKAKRYADNAIRIAPGNADAIALAANIANRMGNKDRAFQLIAPLIDAQSEHVNTAIAFAQICKDYDRVDDAVSIMERILSSNRALSQTSQQSLHFELGKLYDYRADYENSFKHYQIGNTLKSANFNLQRHCEEADALIRAYTSSLMAHAPRASMRSNRPVFVVGMVRSGTSLVEQILSSHPDVYGAGELPDIIRMAQSLHDILGTKQQYPQCLSELTQDAVDSLAQSYLSRLTELSPDAARIVDKMPGNFAHLGLIELLFPDAYIIHCIRDPLDTCLSAYFQDFSQSHLYSYDLTSLGTVYRQYMKIMEHWRAVLHTPILEICYEDLIADQEGVSRRLVEFCGLQWDKNCLQFHRSKRNVTTASYDQVRRPLYEHSVGRWKNYERHLEPLRKALLQT